MSCVLPGTGAAGVASSTNGSVSGALTGAASAAGAVGAFRNSVPVRPVVGCIVRTSSSSLSVGAGSGSAFTSAGSATVVVSSGVSTSVSIAAASVAAASTTVDASAPCSGVPYGSSSALTGFSGSKASVGATASPESEGVSSVCSSAISRRWSSSMLMLTGILNFRIMAACFSGVILRTKSEMPGHKSGSSMSHATLKLRGAAPSPSLASSACRR